MFFWVIEDDEIDGLGESKYIFLRLVIFFVLLVKEVER